MSVYITWLYRRITKAFSHIKHGTVIRHKGKNKLVVKFDDGKTRTLKYKDKPILEVGTVGSFFYEVKRILAFEIDL